MPESDANPDNNPDATPNPSPEAKPAAAGKINSPKGTRDLYPDDLLRQRYITEAWRRVSIRHGFDEIAGPTFEMRELYTRKSGEGIVSELFSFRREGGDDDYALRPEFTPTLARMYAAKAASLPSPTKWFTAGPYFRAERPQRGRLREFLQWNCDVIGGENETGSVDVIAVLLDLVSDLGLDNASVTAKVSDRRDFDHALRECGVPESAFENAYAILDRRAKVSAEELKSLAATVGFDIDRFDDAMARHVQSHAGEQLRTIAKSALKGIVKRDALTEAIDEVVRDVGREFPSQRVLLELGERGLVDWCEASSDVVRGLAYYTGTVFELIADGERAVAGGGRYDNLIELFGGPPTPAVGFGMGDVVLSLLLEDKGLMPERAELREALSQPPASLRPEAFIVSADEERGDPLVEPLLASLRRGVEAEGFDGKPWDAARYAVRPMHARRSYKSTRNLKKLLADGEKQHARFAVIVHDADKVQLRDLDRREELTHDTKGDFSVDPSGDAYVGRAIANLLDAR